MAKAPAAAARRDQSNDAPIEGQVVESTERALASLGGTDAATMDSTMVAILNRSELDQMVVTARAQPRSIQRALDATKRIACLDLQTATECGYALPRGRDDQSGQAKVITGPSIRLAEIVAICWGNDQAASRVTEVNRKEGYVEAEGIFIDFENNFRTISRVRRSIKGKGGRVFNDDMINVTSNAASAIAYRNAVFKGVPKPIWARAYEATQAIVRGDEKTLGGRRIDLLKAYRDNLKIPPEQVYAILSVKGEQDIGLDQLVVAAGFYAALKNNEVTVEDLVRQIAPSAMGPKNLEGAFTGSGAAPGGEGASGTGGSGGAAKDPPAAGNQALATDDKGEPTGEGVDAKTGEISDVLPGKAPAGVVHFLAAAPGLNGEGKRATFKDGSLFSAATPKPEIPIYEEVSEPVVTQAEPEPAAAQKQGGIFEADESEALAEEEEVAEEEEEIEEPAEFAAYRETVSGAESWAAVKKALADLHKVEAFQTATEEVQTGLILAARDVVEALRETGKDPIDPKTDVAYARVFFTGANGAQALPVWQALVRFEGYQKMPEEHRDTLAALYAKAAAR